MTAYNGTQMTIGNASDEPPSWLHFAETYCLACHDVLAEGKPWIFEAWLHLRCTIVHCMSSYGWYDNVKPIQFRQMSFKAQDRLREFAKLCKKNELEEVLTLNLRLISLKARDTWGR